MRLELFKISLFYIICLSQQQAAVQDSHSSGSIPTFKNCIQLAACSADQILPMNPDLPADIFTSCLTTPIKIALRW